MKHSLASLLAGAVLLLGLLATPARPATMILHSFSGSASDGAAPYSSLTLAGSMLYGMATGGGSGGGQGVVFRMRTDGTSFGLLHSFTGEPNDGAFPEGSLTLAGSKLYGMTGSGGVNAGNGVIFSINVDGTGYNLLRSFTGLTSDGGHAVGSLTLSGSSLYGMTVYGGSNSSGTLFCMNVDGTGFTLLHSFTGGATDGKNPNGSVTRSGSKLYGMTQSGGINNVGAVFSINTDGTGFALLHSFIGRASDGAQPPGSLTLSGSALYGMTAFGGSNNKGTIFSMNTDGTGYSLLHSFTGGVSDGDFPLGSLTLVGSTLYGMTNRGGSRGLGTIFSIGTDGNGFALLDSFRNGPASGAIPRCGDLTVSEDGLTLYGMTEAGGTHGGGVVFSHAVPEPGTFALLGLGTLLLSARRRNAGVISTRSRWERRCS